MPARRGPALAHGRIGENMTVWLTLFSRFVRAGLRPLAALALLVVLGPGCMKRADGVSESYGYGGYGPGAGAPAADYAEAETVSSSRAMTRAAPAPKRAAPRAPGAMPAPPPPPMAEQMGVQAAPPEEQAPAPDAGRMIHYTGFARLRVDKVDAATDALAALAARMGGFVERSGGGNMTLRVPVARFDEAMTAVLGSGEVVEKSISAQDVTDAFVSVELRLATLRNTQARLQALLAKSQDEEEKLMLVREIQRVSEEIDRFASQSRTLADLAELSRINVSLLPREALAWQDASDESAAFLWLRQLSPFQQDIVQQGKLLRAEAPAGMVALDLKRRFVAESPEGARLWTGRIDNPNRGDAAFWATALTHRLGRDFALAERSTIAGFEAVRLVSRGDKPYTWFVLIQVRGDELHIAEAYYPSDSVEQRYHKAVVDALIAQFGGGA